MAQIETKLLRQATPRKVKSTYKIAKAARKTSNSFHIGQKKIKLRIDTKTQRTCKMSVPARLIKKSKSVHIQTVASHVPRPPRTLVSRFKKSKTFTRKMKDAVYYQLLVFKASNSTYRKYLQQKEMILAASLKEGYLAIYESEEDKLTVLKSKEFSAQHHEEGHEGDGTDIPPIELEEDEEEEPDFMDCFLPCLQENASWAVPIISVICGGCLAGVAALMLPDPTTLTKILTGAVCAGCAASLGIYFGLCALSCVV